MLHIALHLIIPLIIALIVYPRAWKKSYLIFLSALLIDLDHLLATPIYDATRCSIGFHPLHTALPMMLYAFALLHPKTKLLGIGLCLHVILDSIDCQLTNGVWYTENIIKSNLS